MSLTACPECASTNIYFDKEKNEHECFKCGYKWKEKREFTIHNREYWFSKDEILSELGCEPEDVDRIWAEGKREAATKQPKFKQRFSRGDVIDYEDINEVGEKFWSKNWRIYEIGKDGYLLENLEIQGRTILPFHAEDKMRLHVDHSMDKYEKARKLRELKRERSYAYKKEDLERINREIEELETAGKESLEDLLNKESLVGGIIQSAMWAAKTTLDETAGRVFVQDYAASLNRKGLLANEDVEAFKRWGYKFMRE